MIDREGFRQLERENESCAVAEDHTCEVCPSGQRPYRNGGDCHLARNAIRAVFAREFDRATMLCQSEKSFWGGEYEIMEWSDPKGLRGCGFFRIVDDEIAFQRGYFDDLSFLRQQGLPIPNE